ncbi:hypothetical protein [Bradyrhizobium sp. 27S5]|uniref:hypothetical protein n=1 Tax=Bradyrhizobium sp. 27S5 TaxID=3139728 RepID=UPI0030D4EC5D
MNKQIDDGLGELLKEVKETREALAQQDAARMAALDELRADVAKHSKSSGDTEAKVQRIVDDVAALLAKYQSLEDRVNDICKRI